MMDELSLRDVIEILLKGKWIIAVITAVCVIFAGVYSFAVLDKQYEAETMLMVSPVSLNTVASGGASSIGDLLEAINTYPKMTVETYLQQIKAPEVLEYVREEAVLEELSIDGISRKITVGAVKDTNIIKITVKDVDPQKAADIANIVSVRFTEFVTETSRKQAESSAEYIKTEQEKEKVKLDEIHEKLKDFLSLPRGPEELKLELNAKLNQLTQYKVQLTQAELDEKLVTVKLAKAEELLEKTSEYIEVEKSVAADAFMAQLIREATGAGLSDLASLTMTEQTVNSVYVALVQNINSYEISLADSRAKMDQLQEVIAKGQAEIDSTQAELAGKQQVYDGLQHQYSLIKETYDAYQQKYKEAMIKQSAQIGDSSIIVVSRAVAPETPVGPNKTANVAIGGVIGLMIGSMMVFGKEYWERSGEGLKASGDLDEKRPEEANAVS